MVGAGRYRRRIVMSTHPRTRKRLTALWRRQARPEGIEFLPPFGLFEWISLQAQAFCVVSDSGTLSEEATLKAKKFAYHFFFRRMIPLSFMRPTGQLSVRSPHYAVKINRLDELSAGSDAGLDVICDGILTGAPFIYPAEKAARVPARVA